MIKNVAFIGIGVMGNPMIRHLMEAGYNVTIYYHKDPAKMQPLLDKGAKAAPLHEVAKDADVLFTMLPTEDIVRKVLVGEGGAMEGAKPGMIVVNTSTNSAESNIELGNLLTPKGFPVVDAPVTGSGLQAEAKTIVFVAGGDKAVYEELIPLFNAMGAGSLYAGALGTGSYAKLATNTMMAINMLSFCEALTLAVKCGVDPEVFVAYTAGGGAQSAIADKKIGKILKRDFNPTFRSALMHKDTILAATLAKELKLSMPMLNLTKEMFGISCAEGFADEDYGAVLKLYERWANIIVKK